MARGLYRFYLYAIFIALVVFAVVVTAQFLSTLFSFSALLRGGYSGAPSQAALVQSLVFAIVGWLIAGTLGGLHYWLIRRDLRGDPAAGGSAVRSFFLNATEAIGVLTLVPLVGFSLIGNWAYSNGGSVTFAAGAALPTLAMALLLELERRRFQAHKGAALVFQRLHFFGVQLILLSLMAGSVLNALRPLVGGLFFGGQGVCSDYYCPSYNLFGLAVEMLWFIACWLVYGLVTRSDSSRVVRMLLHGASLAFGIGYILYGVYLALELILSPLFKLSIGLKDVIGFNAPYDFFSPLLLGLIVTVVYHLLLRDISRRGLADQQVRRLTEWVIAALLLAGIFWFGCGYALYNLLQTIAPAPTVPDAHDWVETLALIITGLSYIPLSLYLRRRYALDPVATIGPRRGLVLALLGAGILAFAIGGAAALYAWITALLGSPITNWPQIAHAGLAAFIVGAVVAGIYLWSTLEEHLLTRPTHPEQPPQPTAPTEPAKPATIEQVLDELLAGKITRGEAAKLIRELGTTTALVLV